MTCREAIDRLTEYLDAELTPATLAELETHLAACAPCRAYLATYRETRELAAKAHRVEILEPRAEPLDGGDAQAARLEQCAPLLRSPEAERHVHGAAVATAVQAAVEQLQPQALAPVAIHRFDEEQALAGHADRFVQHALRVGAVVERQRDHARVERAVAEREPGAVVHHVRLARQPEGPDVHGAGPRARARAQRFAHPGLASAEIE